MRHTYVVHFSKIHSAQTTLLGAEQIDIETDISRGLHSFTIVGLGDKAIGEARDRVGAAIKNSGFISPKQRNQKVVTSLAPAHIRKNGALFDVAIALSYLVASGDIEFNPSGSLFFGELALDGNVRNVHGVLPLARFAKKAGFQNIFVPTENAVEAAIIEGITVYPIKNLKQLIAHLHEPKRDIGSTFPLEKILPQPATKIEHIHARENKNTKECHSTKSNVTNQLIDMGDIKGQQHAKRALMIAAAGRHNIALTGPPGTGKTLLAKAFQHILPPLSFEEMLDVTSIHSVAHTLESSLILTPPLRAPHHTASHTSILGGGAHIRPGEVTLAHKGVLFLDEFPEFEKRTLEGLRQPLEDRSITLSRSEGSVRYPADFILIATQNPCPCGFYKTNIKRCICSMHSIMRYQQKISGPIVDRIDMWVTVTHIDQEKVLTKNPKARGESGLIKECVVRTRHIQSERFQNTTIKTNAEMGPKDIERYIPLSDPVRLILIEAARRMHLSIRACHKVMKIARTIADIENKKEVDEASILEALQYRMRN